MSLSLAFDIMSAKFGKAQASMDSFYTEAEIMSLGLNKVGKNVKISRFASLYGLGDISIGDNVRIDDFCILSGKITLESNIHIAAGCYMFAGEAGIEMLDFSTISSRVAIYAISDDYSGATMTNPTVPEEYKNVQEEKVVINKHVIVGTGTIILPGVAIGEGCAVGSASLVTKSLPEWTICFGIPAKPVKDRKKDLLALESAYIKKYR